MSALNPATLLMMILPPRPVLWMLWVLQKAMERTDKDIKAFCFNTADGTPNEKCAWIEHPDNTEPLLLEITENFLNANETGPAINKSLPTLLTASGPKNYPSPTLRIRWWNIYCETLITQWDNPEIWDKMTNPVKQHDPWSTTMQKTIDTVGFVLWKSIELLLKNEEVNRSGQTLTLRRL